MPRRCFLFAIITLVTWLLPVTSAAAGEGCCKKRTGPREQDQIWLISTRHLGCPSRDCTATPNLRIKQYREKRWHSAELEDLLAAASGQLTVTYVHGNRTNWSEAQREGWAVYYKLTAHVDEAPPVCFIMWSWPSDQIRGQVKDVRVKAARTNTDGFYLGWLLERFDLQPNPPSAISVIGYSFGARIAIGGFHVWGDGSLICRRLPESPQETETRGRLVLMAAAEHNYWLQPNSYHGRAYNRIDYAMNLYNSCDRVLKRYRMVSKCSNPRALGYTGLAGRDCFPDGAERFDECNVCCLNGKTHELKPYLYYNSSATKMRKYALWEPIE